MPTYLISNSAQSIFFADFFIFIQLFSILAFVFVSDKGCLNKEYLSILLLTDYINMNLDWNFMNSQHIFCFLFFVCSFKLVSRTHFEYRNLIIYLMIQYPAVSISFIYYFNFIHFAFFILQTQSYFMYHFHLFQSVK
jgi:hypothetical protein